MRVDRETTLAQFKRNTERHQLTINHDDGIYRHLSFRRTDKDGYTSYCYGFDIVTWPGWLAYTGDMGSFVFQRLPDMLEFFRRAPERLYQIDFRYWAEKCDAADKNDGLKEFDPEAFKREITEQRRKLIVKHGRDMDAGERAQMWEELGDVRDAAGDSEHTAITAVQDWNFYVSGKRVRIDTDDFPTCKRHTLRFLWCCYALAWGIQQYDIAKDAAKAAVAAHLNV